MAPRWKQSDLSMRHQYQLATTWRPHAPTPPPVCGSQPPSKQDLIITASRPFAFTLGQRSPSRSICQNEPDQTHFTVSVQLKCARTAKYSAHVKNSCPSIFSVHLPVWLPSCRRAIPPPPPCLSLWRLSSAAESVGRVPDEEIDIGRGSRLRRLSAAEPLMRGGETSARRSPRASVLF